PDEARTIAHRIFGDKDVALETLVREELGLDPSQLGSPGGAALGSFLAFSAGAAIPVIPYLFGGGAVAFYVSLVLSLGALGAVGFGSIFMLVVASLGDDPIAADEAWRREAPDLASDPTPGAASDAERADQDQ